jgi:hypothetical protein
MEQQTGLTEMDIKLWGSYSCFVINPAGPDTTRSAKEIHGRYCGW